mgnify:CR=1 FL=1
MPKEAVSTQDAPKPLGAYSQAVKCGKLIFVSGQLPADPATGGIVVSSTENQTKKVMDNIKAILKAAGADMENIVKTTVYIRKIEEMRFVNAAYALYFPGNPPARSTVQVSRLPKDAELEIDVIASLE